MQPVQNNKLVFICYQLHKTNSKVQKKVIPARKEFAQIQEKFEYIQESAVIKSTNKKQIKNGRKNVTKITLLKGAKNFGKIKNLSKRLNKEA